MKHDKRLNKEDFYHQFHNFHAVSTEHADNRAPFPQNGEVGQVGPAVHFRKDHAKAHPKHRTPTHRFGADAVQQAVDLARQHKRGRP